MARTMKAVAHTLHIKWAYSMAYHPQTDGQTECVNQELEIYLRLYCHNQPDKWANTLVMAEFAYNTRTHAIMQ